MGTAHPDPVSEHDRAIRLAGPGRSRAVAAKILRWRDILGIQRFMLNVSVGTMEHGQVLRTIELLGTEVAERVSEG